MRKRRLVSLAVPQTSAWQISAVRRIDHGRASPVPRRAPTQGRDIGHELVKSRINEIDELQLKHWAPAIQSQTAGNAKNGRFRQRRIKNLGRKFAREFLGQAKDAALGIFDIFAKDHAPLILFQAPPQRLVYGIADPVLSRWQNL